MSLEGKDGPNGCETCRDPGLLLWLSAGTLDEAERLRVEEGARRCPSCRNRLAESDALGRALQLAAPTPAPLSPEALLRISEEPINEGVLNSLAPDDRKILDVLRSVNRDLEAWERRPKWREWISGWLSALAPAPGSGLAGWLRSPAVAYLALLALVYPAYRGLVQAPWGGEPEPRVLSAPVGIAEPIRGERTPVLRLGERTTPPVVTVFVPVDERYRYDIQISDAAGRSRFRQENAQSFDGIGTFALFLPEGFLTAGDWELRVDELDEDGGTVEVFRFPFQVQR